MDGVFESVNIEFHKKGDKFGDKLTDIKNEMRMAKDSSYFKQVIADFKSMNEWVSYQNKKWNCII